MGTTSSLRPSTTSKELPPSMTLGSNWRQALSKIGIAESLSDAILDPAFDNIRKSKSASHWVLETFRIAWEFLEGLDKRVRSKDEIDRLNTPSPSIPSRPAIHSQPSLLDAYNEPPVLKLATIATVPQLVEGRKIYVQRGIADQNGFCL
jgi:hypothetical protein